MEQSSEEFTRVDAVFCDSLYNTTRIVECSNAEYSRLSLKDMNVLVLVDILSVVMDLSGHGYTFRSALQFRIWYELLEGEREDVVDPTMEEDLLMLDDPPTQKREKFEVEAKAFLYVRVLGIYHSNPRVKCLYLRSVADCAIQF